MSKFSKSQIIAHYNEQADKHGTLPSSTIQDSKVKELEILALKSSLSNATRILEIGCGNGYTSAMLCREIDADFLCTDLTPSLIRQANQQPISSSLRSIRFEVQDVLELDYRDQFDAVFTERALQNLPSWEHQQSALMKMINSLSLNGRLVLMESFTQSLENLNAARRELDLSAIEEPWHNVFFDENELRQFLQCNGMIFVEQNPFLSGYYFGSRVLLPALVKNKTSVSSSSVLNDYFIGLPPVGDFCPHKIMIWQKVF